MKENIENALKSVVDRLGIDTGYLQVSYPEIPDHGDYSTNIALVSAKKMGLSAKELAEKIVAELNNSKPDIVDSFAIAGPGFINIRIKDGFYAKEVISIDGNDKKYGWS